MKLLKYIFRNVMRNKLRTALTAMSVGLGVALMTLLIGYMAMQAAWGKEAAQYNRVVVMNIQGFSGAVPIASVDKVQSVEGVKAAVPYSWYGGDYKDERMPFAQFGTFAGDAATRGAFDVWEEFKIDPAELKAWQDNRQGCVADRRLAEERKWKIGERIPIKGTFYPFNLDLTLCGLFDAPQPTQSIWFHWQYLDEGLKQANAFGTGNAGTIFAKAESAEAVPGVMAAIDEKFSSSENPTRTQTESAFAQMFTDMLGNVQFLLVLIGGVVAICLTMVAANAMAMSMRERTTEVAVLKAIGFSPIRVLNMVLGESCLIGFTGGLLGLGLGALCLHGLHRMSSQFFPLGVLDMAGPWMAYILLGAAGVGFLGGVVPAFIAAQRSVIDGLRRVV